jgi:Tfp pilus assembly protein FimT
MIPERQQTGFTTIELVMIIVIIGVLAAVAAAKWPTNTDEWPTALQLAEDIRLAQTLSLNRGGGYSIERVSANSYQILDGGSSVVGGVKVTSASLGAFDIAFDGLGRPTLTGASFTSGLLQITVGSGAAVTIYQETGYVEAS